MFLHFPVSMKLAKISPVFKKIESLGKENCRSVNISTVTSKNFDGIMADQLINVLFQQFIKYTSICIQIRIQLPT